jgi:hypothetical protein
LVSLTDSIASQTAIFEIYKNDHAGRPSNSVESSVIIVTRQVDYLYLFEPENLLPEERLSNSLLVSVNAFLHNGSSCSLVAIFYVCEC